MMPSTQASSHGAGQVVPVNSGKLFVSSSRSSARFQSFWCTFQRRESSHRIECVTNSSVHFKMFYVANLPESL